MNRFLQSVPIFSTPRKFYASLHSAKFFVIIALTISLSIILNGKSRCFSVLAAELQNHTCYSIQDTCGIATLNWIAFLSEMIIMGGNPFVTNMFIRIHSGVLGGRITYQFCMLLTLGITMTGFVVDPESLFVTDTIIQGFSSCVLLSLVTFKLGQLFPEENHHHRTVLLISEVAPWCGVLLCPLYGALVTLYGWQSTYFLIAILILIVCLISGVVEPKPSIYITEDNDYDSVMSGDSEESAGSPNPYTNSDYWEVEDDREVECQHPRLLQLLLNANITKVMSKSIVFVWFLERALAIIAEYNLIINIVNYMTSFLRESIFHGSLVMVTLGCGNIMGHMTVFALGRTIQRHLLQVYIISSMFLVLGFIVWQLYGSVTYFTVPDTHLLVIVIGVLSAMTSAQSYHVAEQIIERPQIIAVSLTKLAQAIGLLVGPITSGMLIQINYFHSFFMVQALIHSTRILLLAYIVFRRYQYSMVNG